MTAGIYRPHPGAFNLNRRVERRLDYWRAWQYSVRWETPDGKRWQATIMYNHGNKNWFAGTGLFRPLSRKQRHAWFRNYWRAAK